MSKDTVFLSHSSKDKKALVAFLNVLDRKTNGTVDFFLSLDGQSIPLGHNWVSSLQAALDSAKLAFVFLTPNSRGSTWIAFECGYMYSKGIRVIPVALPGIDLAQISPPFGLLQGFNMHSHETMNNVFTVLNQHFGHKHLDLFTDVDFQRIFGTDSDLGGGFFGPHTALVNRIQFYGKLNENLLSLLQPELEKLEISLSTTHAKQADFGAAPGVDVVINNEKRTFDISVDPEMCALILPAVGEVIRQSSTAPFAVTVHFIAGVKPCGGGVRVSARAFGTDLRVIPHGFRYREIVLTNGMYNPMHLQSEAPIGYVDLRDLIMLAFEERMLEFNPESANRSARGG